MSTNISVLVSVWNELKKTNSRNEKKTILKELFERLNSDEIEPTTALLLGLPMLTLNVSFATLFNLVPQGSLFSKTLTVRELYEKIKKIAREKGKGSTLRRKHHLEEIYSILNDDEKKFVNAIILNELRCGVSEGLLIDSLSEFSGIDPAKLKSKLSFTESTSSFFKSVMTKGKRALSKYRAKLLSPIRPMLAQSADCIEDVLEPGHQLSFEYKVDGVRIQIHKSRNKVKIFSRSLREISDKFPELIAYAQKLNASSAILDGEVVGVDFRNRPLPFQETMRRFGCEQRFKVIPLIFDLLMFNGKTMLNEKYEERIAKLKTITNKVVPRIVTQHKVRAKHFLKQALSDGHEGLVAKTLDGRYFPGKRSKLWIKIKPYETLDLVITAAEWGHGRRKGWLSNLHLACQGAKRLLPLGKTFKGLTDKDLKFLTKKLLDLEIRRDKYTVYVKPELVCEISFNEIQRSPHYESGFALRFARVKAIREDKKTDEINTIDDVIRIYQKGITVT